MVRSGHPREARAACAALAAAAGDQAGRLAFAEGGRFDLQVAIGETLLETRFSEWAEALAGVVDGADAP